MARAPQQQPQQEQDSIALQKFTGLRNTVSPERLGPDELETARNVDLDDAGQLHRRRGFRRVATGNFHSLFESQSGVVYGVKNNALGIVNPDWTFYALRYGLGPNRLAYTQVGPTIYYSSGADSGQIDVVTGIVNDWGARTSAGIWDSPVTIPTDTLPEIRGRLLGKPPLATSLAYFNGRIYLGSGPVVWATSLYLYDYVDKTKNYLYFEADITFIGAVTDGIYVGTTAGVWFLSGAFNEMRRVPITSYAGIPGSLVSIPAELANPRELVSLDNSKNAVIFLTSHGLMAGFDSGYTFNLTQTRVWFPDAMSAAPMFRQQDGINQYVAVANSGGTPSSNARIGDYVDAEIRRGGTWRHPIDNVGIGDSASAEVV